MITRRTKKLISSCLIIVTISFSVLYSGYANGSKAQNADWKLVRNESGITVYTLQNINSDIIKARASGIVNASIGRINELVMNIAYRHKWVPYLKICRKPNGSSNLEYALFEAPWPASDRDFIYSVTQTIKTPTDILYEMTSVKKTTVKELEPYLETDAIRADLFEASYRMLRVDDNRTHLAIIYHTDPKGWLPDWIINIIQQALPYKIIENIRQQVETGEPRD